MTQEPLAELVGKVLEQWVQPFSFFTSFSPFPALLVHELELSVPQEKAASPA